MYMGYYDWMISRNSDYSSIAFIVTNDGNVNGNRVSNNVGVRPSFNLSSSITYVSGSGSMSNPIRVNWLTDSFEKIPVKLGQNEV